MRRLVGWRRPAVGRSIVISRYFASWCTLRPMPRNAPSPSDVRCIDRRTAVLCAVVWPALCAAADDAALLRELRAGAAVLMRHTQTAPGVGDPEGWRIDDCKSQRNLDDSGVAHAK